MNKLREEASGKAAELTKIDTEVKAVQAQLLAKEKEVSRQDGLMKLKDKKIAELNASEETIKSLMNLVSEYQQLLVGGKPARDAPEDQPPASKRRVTMYHDAKEGADDTSME